MIAKNHMSSALTIMSVSVAACLVVAGLVYYLFWVRTALPKQRPADLKIQVYDGGGMLNISSTYRIEAGQGFYEFNYDNTIISAEYTPTAAELDTLWQTIHQARFDQLKTYEEVIHDRGGTSIVVTYDDERFAVSNSGSSFLRRGSTKGFAQVKNAVIDLAEQSLAAQKKSVTIVLQPEVVTAVTQMQFNNAVIYSGETATTALSANNSTITAEPLLPGDYDFLLVTEIAGTGKFAQPVYTHQPVTITADTTISITGTAEQPVISTTTTSTTSITN